MFPSIWRLTIVLMLTMSLYVESKQSVTVFTHDDLPPFVYRDESGKLTGLYIETVRKANTYMDDFDIKFVVVPWVRAKELARTGEAFAILAPYFHAHDWLLKGTNKPFIWPYSRPIYKQQDVVVCADRVARGRLINFPDDYRDLSFVMWRGDGRAGKQFEKLAESGKIKVVRVATVETAIKLIRAGRVDCTVTSRIPYQWLSKRLSSAGEDRDLHPAVNLIVLDILYESNAYLGYSNVDVEKRYPFKEEFSIAFDVALYKMERNGELQNIATHFVDEYVKAASEDAIAQLWSFSF